ncbi:MAG: hypothetical protein WC073_11295 [Sterolibacterium sp.]
MAVKPKAKPVAKQAPAKKQAKTLTYKRPVKFKVKKPTAKPTTAQLLDAIGIDEICEQVAECSPLREIADKVGVSKGSLINWLANHADQYARAREAQADVLATDILTLADVCRVGTITTEKANGDVETKTTDMVERARLQIDARKWLAGKMAPKKYGDRLTHAGDAENPLAVLTMAQISTNPASRIKIGPTK